MANFATGFQAGVGLMQARDKRARDEEARTWRREDREREVGMRKAGEDTLGRIGQERTTDYQMAPGATGSIDDDGTMAPVKSAYTARQGYHDYASKIAGMDPARSAQFRGMADQEELRGLQTTEARRIAEARARETKFFEFKRKTAGLPDDEALPMFAQFATEAVQDGQTFGMDFDPNTGYSAVVIGKDGRVQRLPITDRRMAEQELMKYISPEMYDRVSREQRQDKTDARLDRTLDEAVRGRDDDRGYRRDVLRETSRHHQAVEGLHGRRIDAVGGRGSSRDRMAEMEGQVKAYSHALLQSGRAKTPEEATRMAWGAVIKDPTGRGADGWRAVAGSKGMFTDGQNFARLDEESNTLVPVRTQQSLTDIAKVIDRNLGQRGGGGQQAAPAPRPGGLANALPGRIGPLTSASALEAAAASGDRRAQAELERRSRPETYTSQPY